MFMNYVILLHQVLGICHKPMSTIGNNMSCLLEVNWVWNLKLTANRVEHSVPHLIDSTINMQEVLQMGISN
jgi:hypothetical protein